MVVLPIQAFLPLPPVPRSGSDAPPLKPRPAAHLATDAGRTRRGLALHAPPSTVSTQRADPRPASSAS